MSKHQVIMVGDVKVLKISKSQRQLLADLHFIFVDGWRVTVKAGFITDGVSLPWFMWWFLSPFGQAFEGAILHDCLVITRRIYLTGSHGHEDLTSGRRVGWFESTGRFLLVLKSICEIPKWKLPFIWVAVNLYGIYRRFRYGAKHTPLLSK